MLGCAVNYKPKFIALGLGINRGELPTSFEGLLHGASTCNSFTSFSVLSLGSLLEKMEPNLRASAVTRGAALRRQEEEKAASGARKRDSSQTDLAVERVPPR